MMTAFDQAKVEAYRPTLVGWCWVFLVFFVCGL
jgi:hypothetical protein